jgi:hypothetical protein
MEVVRMASGKIGSVTLNAFFRRREVSREAHRDFHSRQGSFDSLCHAHLTGSKASVPKMMVMLLLALKGVGTLLLYVLVS